MNTNDAVFVRRTYFFIHNPPQGLPVDAALQRGLKVECTAVRDVTLSPRLTRRLQDIAKEIESIDLRAKEEGRDGLDTPDEDWDEEAL